MQKTFNQSFSKVYDACLDTLDELDITVDSENKQIGIIKASTESTLLSWGEEIKIILEKVEASKTKVIVKSEATAQVFSWGKNDKNEASILKYLSNQLK